MGQSGGYETFSQSVQRCSASRCFCLWCWSHCTDLVWVVHFLQVARVVNGTGLELLEDCFAFGPQVKGSINDHVHFNLLALHRRGSKYNTQLGDNDTNSPTPVPPVPTDQNPKYTIPLIKDIVLS